METKKTKILVIGGTGFVGEFLVRSLSKKKNCRIFVIHNSLLSGKEKISGIEYCHLDLKKDFGNSRSRKFLKDLDTAVIMTQPDGLIISNILKALDLAVNLKKIVYISTILVYSSSEKKQKETGTINPISPYEKGKAEEEKLLTEYSSVRKIKLAVLRLANVYGGRKNRGIIGLMFNILANGGDININGDGLQKRDYIFVEEAAEFIRSVIFLEQKKSVEILNVCTGKGYTINKLISLVEKTVKQKLSVNHGLPIKEKKIIVGDNKKIYNLLGRKPKINLQEGLKRAYFNIKHGI